MKGTYGKIYASAALLLIAVIMIVTVSYAWITMSTSPEVSGIQVAIAGGNTILLAPDVTKTVTDEEGKETVVHYPGAFSDRLDLSAREEYSYLTQLAPLTPVSTADGRSWILPTYDSQTGLLEDTSLFQIDTTLSHGNVREGQGSYIYLDFWIVSPGAEYDVHVSADQKTGTGSFLMELPLVEQKDGEAAYTIRDSQGVIASTARVGFLVNEEAQQDSRVMEAYMTSSDYEQRYRHVLGKYQEPGDSLDMSTQDRFTIYEPNSTRHPFQKELEGAYVQTLPLSCTDIFERTISETDVSDRVTAQTAAIWREDAQLQETLELAAVQAGEGASPESVANIFYSNYMKERTAAFVTPGDFYYNSEVLCAALDPDGIAWPDVLSQNLKMTGATEDVVLTTLQRNTPQRVRMFIWLEGQDIDSINTSSIDAAAFALNIQLSGETHP